MKKGAESEFVSYLEELGSGLGEVEGKRMFGGHGLFLDGKMFAIVDEGVLFFKADDENEGDFEELELPRFTYQRREETMSLRYRRAPEEATETARAFVKWAEGAVAAAKRAKK